MSKVWVTRNKSNVAMPVLVFNGKRPVYAKGFWCCNLANELTEMHTPGSFNKKYGSTPRKGSCKQYELSLKEIK